MQEVSRKSFLKICLGGVVVLSAGALVSVVSAVFRFYLIPPSDKDTRGKVRIPLKDIAAGDAKFFEYNGSAAVLIMKQGGSLLALSAVCPHLGCIVQWEKVKQQFICPCHAGYFTADGEVISGPPPGPLARLQFTVANGTVSVG